MTSEAWVLHKIPSGDTSLRLSLFSREMGVLSCLYKGGRTPKKQALIQAFIPLWVSLAKTGNSYFVRHLEIHAPALELKNTALYAALYLNELLYYLIKPLDPHPELYDHYKYTLHGLTMASERLTIESLLRKFEWVLLAECGYSLAFTEQAAQAEYYRFWPNKGFVPALDGFPRAEILTIIEGQFHDINLLKSAKIIMRQAIDFLLEGKELKSRQLFNVARSPHYGGD